MINYIYFESPDWRTFSCERLPVKPTAKDIFDTGIPLAAKLRMYNSELSTLKAKSVKVGNYEILEAIDHPNQNAHTLCFDGQWYVRYDEIIEWSGSVEIKKDVHCDEYHQHTKESCFVKVAILKIPETPIAMEQTKEQDAAHSFDETLNDIELKANFYAMEYAPFMLKVFEKFSLYEHHETKATGGTELIASLPELLAELTRLRDLIAEQKSELQQKDEVIQELVEVLSFYYHRSEREVNRLRSLIEKSKAK